LGVGRRGFCGLDRNGRVRIARVVDGDKDRNMVTAIRIIQGGLGSVPNQIR